jgi:hypothetical protein
MAGDENGAVGCTLGCQELSTGVGGINGGKILDAVLPGEILRKTI